MFVKDQRSIASLPPTQYFNSLLQLQSMWIRALSSSSVGEANAALPRRQTVLSLPQTLTSTPCLAPVAFEFAILVLKLTHKRGSYGKIPTRFTFHILLQRDDMVV